MVNVAKLKGKIVEKGSSVELLAKHIGINKSTLYRQIAQGGGDISLEVANKIVLILNLTTSEALDIFLPAMSHKCDN